MSLMTASKSNNCRLSYIDDTTLHHSANCFVGHLISALKSCAWLQLAKKPQLHWNAVFMLVACFQVFRLLKRKVLANVIKKSSPEAGNLTPISQRTELAWDEAYMFLMFNLKHAVQGCM